MIQSIISQGRNLLLLALAVMATGCVSNTAVAASERAKANGERPPNVIIILADDAGYADFGFAGSDEIATPNIDALAKSGVVFEQAYATTPFCSPSRAGLLTGRYPQRYGYEFNLTHEPPPGIDARYMGLDVDESTIGDLFKAAGYRTIAIGKWHVGSQPQFHPNVRGFDEFYGLLGGGSTYFPDRIAAGKIERNGEGVEASKYLTDEFADEAVAQISQSGDQPFLLYLAFNAVHTPMDALPEDIARFAHIEDPQRRRLAAMTWAMDRAIGKVMDALEAKGLTDDTLVIFTNDNGGDRIGLDADNTPLRGTKGTLLEGGIRVPMIAKMPMKQGAGTQVQGAVSLMDILPTALEVAGAPVPGNLDGVSLLGLGQSAGSRPLFWRYDTTAAVRNGKWKLLRFPDRPAQLYDLSVDVGEMHDLAAENRELVTRLMQQLFAWEATIEHRRWHTGTYWSQEDIRRYSETHVEAAIARSKAELSGQE